MILYFTGTGNSEYIAKRLAESLDDQLVSINERIKQDRTDPLDVSGKLIFVVPVYSTGRNCSERLVGYPST